MVRILKLGVWLLPLLVGTLAVLSAMAYASPPDPAWVPGVYDDADYDDVVIMVTSGSAVVVLTPPPEPRFVPPRITKVIDRTTHHVPILAVSARRPRAPPTL